MQSLDGRHDMLGISFFWVAREGEAHAGVVYPCPIGVVLDLKERPPLETDVPLDDPMKTWRDSRDTLQRRKVSAPPVRRPVTGSIRHVNKFILSTPHFCHRRTDQ